MTEKIITDESGLKPDYRFIASVDGPTLVKVSLSRCGGSNWFQIIDTPEELADLVEQAKVGTRFEIISCYDITLGEPRYVGGVIGSY